MTNHLCSGASSSVHFLISGDMRAREPHLRKQDTFRSSTYSQTNYAAMNSLSHKNMIG